MKQRALVSISGLKLLLSQQDDYDLLDWYYRIGRQLLAIRNGSGYGNYLIPLLVEKLGCKPNLLFNAQRLAKAFSQEDIRLFRKKGVSCFNALLLALIKDSGLRRELMKQALVKSWSTAQGRDSTPSRSWASPRRSASQPENRQLQGRFAKANHADPALADVSRARVVSKAPRLSPGRTKVRGSYA